MLKRPQPVRCRLLMDPADSSAPNSGARLAPSNIVLPKKGRVARTARSQPAIAVANDLKSRGKIMGENGADMKRGKASM